MSDSRHRVLWGISVIAAGSAWVTCYPFLYSLGQFGYQYCATMLGAVIVFGLYNLFYGARQE